MKGLPPGTLLADRFEILGVLGRGGMATVLLAHDRLLDERVAVKVLHAHLADDPAMQARLQREVQAAARVRHPAALVANELHSADGHTFLTLPYHTGETLSERVAAKGPMGPNQVRALGVRLSAALAQAHRNGVLHRDVNPNNVMVTEDGEAVLMDFGLARLHSGATGHTTGVLGTTGYAAPEALDGHRGDPRSDLYGLGATLYLAMTGEAPFAAATPLGVVQRQLADNPTPPSELGIAIPQDLEQTILALLAGDPNARPQSASEVARSLAEARPPESLVHVGQPSLPAGPWLVLVGETGEDKGRRQALRVDRGLRPSSAGSDFQNFLRNQVWGGVKQALGIPEGIAPEEHLVRGLARSANLPDTGLTTPDALLEPRFRLVDGVDETTAKSLQTTASQAGFKAQVFRIEEPQAPVHWIRRGWVWTLLALIAMGIGGIATAQFLYTFVALLGTILTVLFWGLTAKPAGQVRDRKWAEQLPLAYGSLESHLAPGHRVEASLIDRVRSRLDRLEEELAQGADAFTESALVSGRSNLARLREQAEQLAEDLERYSQQLDTAVKVQRPDAELAWLITRRDRLMTRQRAGESIDVEELARVATELEDQADAAAVVEALQARHTSITTRLLELAGSAHRARQDLSRARAENTPAAPVLARLARATEDPIDGLPPVRVPRQKTRS
jgi:serine/threonine-protein kinase